MPNTDNATERTLQLYTVPQRIQSTALDMLQEKVLDGKEMPDGNNPTTFLLEFAATMAAGITNEVSQSLSSLYPSRALTTADLYRHMSDYDYVNLFSTPATSSIEVALNRDYLIQNAVRYGTTDYKKITIPAYSTFGIGEYTFGIHYPIDILIKEARNNGAIDYDNCLITTQWDTSVNNPLLTLETNILENRTYTRDGITLLCISIPIHQFVTTTHQDDAVASTGFSKRYTYTDRFYAARIFHYKDGSWIEMAQTLSDIVHDPLTPTAKLSVLTDMNTLQVDIPQVYFTTNLIGTKIRTILYTTKGALDIDTSEYAATQYSASFLVNDDIAESDVYSSMLKRLPYCQVLPRSSRIVGGSNGLTFEELRSRVVHDSTYTLLITSADIINYFEDQGFVAKRYLDNITDRIYLAQRVMTDGSGVTISAGDITAVFDSKVFYHSVNPDTGLTELDNYRTIKYISEQSFMVLPNTVFLYDLASNTVTPMDNDWMDAFDEMSSEQKVNLMNENNYTYTPFHLKLTVSNDTPVASYYDLLQPKITNTTFAAENTNLTSQISIYDSGITHLENGTGGYRLAITLYKTSDMERVSVLGEDGLTPNVKVVLKTTDGDGQVIYMYGRYAGKSDNRDVFVFDINTEYKIDEDDELDTNSFKSRASGQQVGVHIPLEHSYDLMFFVNREFITTAEPMVGVDSSDFPPDITGADIWLATQRFTLKLGEPVTTLFTNVSVNLESQQYQTYPTTVYATYTAPVYARYTAEDAADENQPNVTEDMIGMLKYPLELEHDEGEVILAPVTNETIPPACKLVFTSTDEETGEPVQSEKSLYLQTPYTSTSFPSNMWVPPSKDYTAYDETNKYSIEVVDVLGYALDDLNRYPNAVVGTYRDLRIQFRDVTIQNEDGTETVVRESYDPLQGSMFAFVTDSSIAPVDNSVPENNFTVSEKDATGALYRRNVDYSNFDYTDIQYRKSTDTDYQPLTAEILEEIYNQLDGGKSADEVSEMYNIGRSQIEQLRTVVRTPWIRTLNAASPSEIQTYWDDNRQILNTTATVVAEIQRNLVFVPVYDKYENLPVSLEKGQIVYVSDVSDQSDTMGERLFGDIESDSLQVKGALLRKQTDGYEWLITGPSKQLCISTILAVNCYNGFAYLVLEGGVPKYINLLSYDDDGSFNMDLDTYNWALINKWPWEVATRWVDIENSTYSTLDVDIISDPKLTSVKIREYGGDVKLDENGNLIGLITDANGNPVEETDEYADTRKIVYNVRTLQVDYKLTLSTESEHVNYRNDIVSLLRSYFSTIKTASAALLEETYLYYAPIRTMGYAEFKSTNGAIESRPLDITMGFRLYVQEYITNSDTNKEMIMNNVLSIIDAHMATGSISTTRLAEEIRESLSDTVQYVENLGINGDPELRILILNETMDECVPHLKQTLVLDDSGDILVNRGVTLEYVSIS